MLKAGMLGREKAGPWPLEQLCSLVGGKEEEREGKAAPGIPHNRGPLRGTLFSPFAAIRPHERRGARVGRDKKAGKKKA